MSGSSSCVNKADVIDRKHGKSSVKLIAIAGACLRLLIKVIKFIPKGEILMGGMTRTISRRILKVSKGKKTPDLANKRKNTQGIMEKRQQRERLQEQKREVTM